MTRDKPSCKSGKECRVDLRSSIKRRAHSAANARSASHVKPLTACKHVRLMQSGCGPWPIGYDRCEGCFHPEAMSIRLPDKLISES